MRNGPEWDAAQRAVRAEYWRQLVHQIDVAQKATQISPVAAYQYLGEAFCSTGVLRYRAFMLQADQYRRQLFEFIKQRDATDPNSNHKLIQGHTPTISRLPVHPEEVPRFAFREAPLNERFQQATRSVVILLLFNLIFFIGAYWSFRRCDVR